MDIINGLNSCINLPKEQKTIGEKLDLIPYINANSKLWEFCYDCYMIEQILINDELRNLYLATLISSDTIVDIESSKIAIEKLNKLKLVLPYLGITDKIKKDTLKFINKGLKIAKSDLNKFEFELLKDYR